MKVQLLLIEEKLIYWLYMTLSRIVHKLADKHHDIAQKIFHEWGKEDTNDKTAM